MPPERKKDISSRGTSVVHMTSMARPMVGIQAPSPPNRRASTWVTAPNISPAMTMPTALERTKNTARLKDVPRTSLRVVPKPMTASTPYSPETVRAGPHTWWPRICVKVRAGRR